MQWGSLGWAMGTLPGPEHRSSARVTSVMGGPVATAKQPRYLSSHREGVERLGLSP